MLLVYLALRACFVHSFSAGDSSCVSELNDLNFIDEGPSQEDFDFARQLIQDDPFASASNSFPDPISLDNTFTSSVLSEQHHDRGRKRQPPSNYVGLTLDVSDSSLKLQPSVQHFEQQPLASVDYPVILEALDGRFQDLILHGDPVDPKILPEGFAKSEFVYQAEPFWFQDSSRTWESNLNMETRSHDFREKAYAGWYYEEDTSTIDKRRVLRSMAPIWGYSNDENGKKATRRRMAKYINKDLAQLILDNPNNIELLKEVALQTPPQRHSALNTDEQRMRLYLKEHGMHINTVSTYMKKAKEMSREVGIPLDQAVIAQAAKFKPETKVRERKGAKKMSADDQRS